MVEVNLLPQSYRKESQPSAWRYATYALIPLTAAAILIPEVLTATRIGDLTRQIEALNGEVDALKPAKAEFDALTREKADLEQVTAIATQLRSAKSYWVNDLAAFTAQLPSGGGVAVSSLNMRNVEAGNLSTLQQSGVYTGKNVVREIDLTGTAASQQAVVNFLRTFETNPNFGVNFKSLQSSGEAGAGAGEAANTYTFNASVGVVGAPATPAGTTDGETPAPETPTPSAPSTLAPPAPASMVANTPGATTPGGSRVQ